MERVLRQVDPLSLFLFLLAVEGFHVMMMSLVATGLFRGYHVGRFDGVSTSHLQFVDDTLLLDEKSWANVQYMRAVLIIFEQVSGLKVNFNKSMLTGVNVSDSLLTEVATVMNCRVGMLPFCTWGCPLGVMLGDWSFGNLWLIGLLIDCQTGKASFFVGWSPGTSEICHVISSGLLSLLLHGTCGYNFFPSSRHPRV